MFKAIGPRTISVKMCNVKIVLTGGHGESYQTFLTSFCKPLYDWPCSNAIRTFPHGLCPSDIFAWLTLAYLNV